MDGMVREAKENRCFKLDVSVVMLVFLRKSKTHDGSGVAVEVVAARRLKPIPDFVPFADAPGKGYAPELDGFRIRFLRLGYRPDRQEQQTN